MLGLGSNQENKFEALRQQNRDACIEIMDLRLSGNVRQGVYNAKTNPEVIRVLEHSQENERLAKAEAEKLEFEQEIARLEKAARLESADALPIEAADFSRETAESATLQGPESLYDRAGIDEKNKMEADARARAASAHADTHEHGLKA